MNRRKVDELVPPTVAMLIGLLAASACSQSATSASPVISWTTELAADIPVPTTDAGASALLVTAAWGGPGQLRIVTWGSSGCPELPDSVSGTGHTMTVTTKALNPSGGGCTGDAAAATSTVAVPAEVDPTRSVAITINGTTITLPGR